MPCDKAYCLKMEICSSHEEDDVYISMINEDRRINKVRTFLQTSLSKQIHTRKDLSNYEL